MKLARLIIGEFVLLFASILIFRSIWTLLDQYFGSSELWLFLVIGLILTVVGLFIVNYEVKCQLEKKNKPTH